VNRTCGWQFFLCSVAISVPGLLAEDAQSLTLKQVQEIALRNHPRISQAELEALASKQVVNEVRAGFFPNVKFNATAVDAFESNTRLAAGGLNNPSVFDRNAEGLTATQLLTDFGRTAHLLNSSQLYSRAQDANAEATREQILLQVDVAFFAALKAQSVLVVAHQTQEARSLLLDQVSALATNKLRSDLDLSFAKVSFEEANLLVAQAQNDVEAAFAVLAQLLGERQKRAYHLIEEPLPPATMVDGSTMVDTALTKRPDLARLRLERDAAEQYAKAQRALSYPTINAIGSAGLTPVRDPDHFDSRYAAAGVNLNLPIFDGGLNSAKRSEAQFRAEASAEKLRDAENTAIHDVRTAGLNLNYAFERLELTQELSDNAGHAFELAEARYQAGSSSIVELSQAQLNKTEADIAHTGAKYDYEIQRSILNFEVGLMQ